MKGTNTETIHIIMATYNGATYLREQLDSILKSTYSDWKLFIYDDGSNDDTISIVKEYEQRYPKKIKFHPNEKNLGVVHNFLQGVVNSKACYLMFCDQDDVWKEDKILHTYERMKQLEKKEKSSTPIAVFTDAVVVDEALKQVEPSFHRSSKLDTTRLQLNDILMENKMIGCTSMINRPLIELLQTMPLHPRLHDWWIALVAATFGKLAYLNEPTLYYRQHGNNVVGNVSFIVYLKQRVTSLSKQKKALLLTMQQAKDLYEMYEPKLSERSKEIIRAFMNLNQKNWVAKRVTLFKYRFYKTGLIRNVGVFLII